MCPGSLELFGLQPPAQYGGNGMPPPPPPPVQWHAQPTAAIAPVPTPAAAAMASVRPSAGPDPWAPATTPAAAMAIGNPAPPAATMPRAGPDLWAAAPAPTSQPTPVAPATVANTAWVTQQAAGNCGARSLAPASAAASGHPPVSYTSRATVTCPSCRCRLMVLQPTGGSDADDSDSWTVVMDPQGFTD